VPEDEFVANFALTNGLGAHVDLAMGRSTSW
jgi:hypothetical protein